MSAYKTTSYEKVEKLTPDKKFKRNSYEEIRKLVEDNDVERQQIDNIVKNKNKKNTDENKYSFKLFD